MKKLFLLILSVSILTITSAQSGLPGTWNQNSAYSSGSLVISSGSTYLAQQQVPAGTALTSTAYWLSLDSAVPTTTPGTAPTSTPDVSTAPTSTPASDTNTTNTTVTPSGLSTASNEAFVKQQYLDFLGRDGDDAGIAFWTAELTNGTQSRADCVNSFVFSEEFQQKVAPVSRLFLAYFMRIPDTSGLQFWINEKLNGKTINTISDSFAASTEFINTYGSLDNTAFVNLVYSNLFNRTADTGGFNYWKGQLDTGVDSRGNVMASFSESTENVSLTQSNIRVISFYYGMLRRAPDQGGYDFWVNELKIGKSPNELINGFIGSAEYQQRF